MESIKKISSFEKSLKASRLDSYCNIVNEVKNVRLVKTIKLDVLFKKNN